MSELVRQNETGLSISTETSALIQSSIVNSTLKWYTRLSKELEHGFVPQSENPDKSGVVRC